MSRSYHQSHPAHVGKRARRPRPERKRKHQPYGIHRNRYDYEWFKKQGWGLDSDERWECSNIATKAKARREGREEIERELEDMRA